MSERKFGKIYHVSIYDVVVETSNQYLVMEYVDGCSLKEYMDKKGKLTEEETFKIISQLLDALQHAHENNIIHRDIKSDEQKS